MLSVVIKEPRKAPFVAEIDESLASMQAVVGGFIEVLPVHNTEGGLVVCICDEDGKMKQKDLNFWRTDQAIVGTVFFCVLNEKHEFVSLLPWQKSVLMLFLKTLHKDEQAGRNSPHA